ncbi:putative receptor-type adenylate cyclase GRESAG 4 [Trypanosoma theileri]|uniref:Putative receptor-type adenylate cyclase GRESAG 4 n=1 Tax=Trypanosoma theileri TaxID=67003 RepID=A0A1X0P6Q5_9TRYP|nr:putative receptor-type adenylate cyclase GRESAG 4 [Trypanosoma theileri]ORC92604.1 putative receptor-type adenylate cyclase GRESAG 4 [Trypanosoma theileri]
MPSSLLRNISIIFLGVVALYLTIQVVDASSNYSSQISPTEVNISKHKMEKRIYSLMDHLLRIGVYLFLSAVFAGLTIGIMCMDTLTIDIIANSGPEPDRTYASQIQPLRRQGHQTLCTLVLSNMLMNVLVVQETSKIIDLINDLEGNGLVQQAVDQNGALASFIVSTVIIIIFTEIIPMSICKSKYSLRIAAAGCTLVRIAIILVYPVAMPLGKLLDCFVPHDAGQIYDRNELRKLMALHCETHGDRSALATTELQLLIAAMDFHEKKVRDIMTPIEEVISVRASEVITSKVIEQLWESGCSRIPVEMSPGDYVDVLLVKDLLTLTIPIDKSEPITIGEFVRNKSRIFATVSAKTSLPTVLRFFQHSKTHMLLVTQGEKEDEKEADGGTKNDDHEINVYSFYNTRPPLGKRQKFVGIVTLEDLVEALIKGEIYDEYDCYEYCIQDRPHSAHTSIPMALNGVPLPEPEPAEMPRANFYSYYVHMDANVPLTEAQVWAVAYYLTRAVSAFFLWHPGYVKMLLDECGDEQHIPPLETTPPTPIKHEQGEGGEGGEEEEESDTLDSPLVLSTGVLFSDTSSALPLPFGSAMRMDRFPDLISKAADERFILYRNGEESKYFTLVLGGKVDVLVKPNNFVFKRRSFEWLADKVLTTAYYAPDYDAVILSPTRIYRISKERYEQYLVYNNVYNRTCERMEFAKRKPPASVRRPLPRPASTQVIMGSKTRTTRDDDKKKLLRPQDESNLYGTFEI